MKPGQGHPESGPCADLVQPREGVDQLVGGLAHEVLHLPPRFEELGEFLRLRFALAEGCGQRVVVNLLAKAVSGGPKRCGQVGQIVLPVHPGVELLCDALGVGEHLRQGAAGLGALGELVGRGLPLRNLRGKRDVLKVLV